MSRILLTFLRLRENIMMQPEMPRCLVVFYSLTGNTAFIAEEIAEELTADILRLEPQKEIPRNVTRYFFGGRQNVRRETPPLKPFRKDPVSYEMIIIGSPVWAWDFAPPVRSFLRQVDLSGKKTAVFCCSHGMAGATLQNLRAALASAGCLAELQLIDPLSRPKKNKEIIHGWCRRLAQEEKSCDAD